MLPITVLLTFYSRGGSTETLTLSTAVGAVQLRALIRLRRVADLDAAQTLARFPEHGETLRRMHKEYVTPTEADVLGADALVIAAPPGMAASAPELAPYLTLLDTLGRQGRLAGKVAAVLDTGDAAARAAFADRLLQCGLIAVPRAGADAGPLDAARAITHGRRLVTVARAVKALTPAP